MKKILLFTVLIIQALIAAQGQTGTSVSGQQQLTATVRSAVRFFKEKDDLTSVIMIIPAGSTVAVTGSDSSFYEIEYDGNKGFIDKKQAVISDKPLIKETEKTTQATTGSPVVRENSIDRFTYLENKYGKNVATKINAGKIWKGMSPGMVRDSWGSPRKINRVINGNVIDEEWTYNRSTLYFKNNTLIEWGPRK